MLKEDKPVPKDERGHYIYTPEQIEHYRAVMAYEVRRQGGNPSDSKQASLMTLMAGGVGGKSALLYRIASGRAPLVIPAPTAMSYPWYGVVEEEGPWELTMEGENLQKQLDVGAKTAQWANRKGPIILIEQSIWNVVRQIDDVTAEVSWPGWQERGYLWRLSLDVIPATESRKTILPRHNPSLKKITTLVDLQNEQRWDVSRFVAELEESNDPVRAADAIEAGRQKDADARSTSGYTGRFSEFSVTHRVEAQQKLIAERIASGKSAIPDEQEQELMFQEHMARYLAPRDVSGFGWYSVDQAGGLLAHGWRLHRIAPTIPPEDLYLDVDDLPRAPEGFLQSKGRGRHRPPHA